MLIRHLARPFVPNLLFVSLWCHADVVDIDGVILFMDDLPNLVRLLSVVAYHLQRPDIVSAPFLSCYSYL